ncbi:amidase [Herbaspirillum sp. alder98]|uniref:amidase n=1 Tax=Herbaspirillum sp. alder98 TaxID=2913096 RepID=UPI001CD90FCB|nr:amidase [Herbaspirillum sp. alder98]MCA1325617.1 amidase [Herbaspirillum sp. alder98]
MELVETSVTDLLAGYRNRTISPVEVIGGFLSRIAQVDPLLNAFSEVDAQGAMQAAAASEQRWQKGQPLSPFDGLPASLKDQWPLQGFATRSGSLTTDPAKIATEDAPAAQRLREGGAVFLGKTNLCEFSWNGVTRSTLKGESRNPWNPRMNCGGSSGGAAIAAAARLSILNVGSDGAGSIRIPAAFCGVFGFKPTYGVVPAYPQGQLINCSHTGPITRTVLEAALMLDAITRYDPREWLATGDPQPRYVSQLDAGVKGLRIGYSRSLAGAHANEAVTRVVDQAVRVFADQGAILTEVDDDFPDPRPAFEVIYESSLAAGLENFTEDQKARLDPGLVRNGMRGFSHTAQALIRAFAAREELGRAMNLFHEQFDLLITPQLAVTAFECGQDVPAQSGMREWLDWSPFTYMFNLTQQPAAAVPCGFVEGLPVALQIVGPRHADLRVMQAARAFEQIQPFATPVLAGIGAP